LLSARARDLTGILNGVDYAIWNPRTDPYLPESYDPRRLAPKRASKQALRRRLGLPDTGTSLLLGVVSRLTWQKGTDLLLDIAPWLERHDAQLAIVGTGARELEDRLRELAAACPARVALHLGYDESLAHLAQGGCDSMLVPSRSEPCGLTQLYALKYGSPPVVHRVGGLVDTIVDLGGGGKGRGTGIVFEDPTGEAFLGALDRLAAAYADRARWRRLQQAAMAADFGWRGAATRYVELYEEIAPRGSSRRRGSRQYRRDARSRSE
jgi:starch synthase